MGEYRTIRRRCTAVATGNVLTDENQGTVSATALPYDTVVFDPLSTLRSDGTYGLTFTAPYSRFYKIRLVIPFTSLDVATGKIPLVTSSEISFPIASLTPLAKVNGVAQTTTDGFVYTSGILNSTYGTTFAVPGSCLIQSMTFISADNGTTVYGADQNYIEVDFDAGGTAGSETVAVTGSGTSGDHYIITVTLEDGVSTRDQVIAAVNGDATAYGIVKAALVYGASGSGTVTATASPTQFTSGSDGTLTLADATNQYGSAIVDATTYLGTGDELSFSYSGIVYALSYLYLANIQVGTVGSGSSVGSISYQSLPIATGPNNIESLE